jgi:L-aspartate oxidase
VTPAAHYQMGGVAVDLDGHTSLPGLWACGEVAATGLHGANRLASNSLLEALVFGRRAAHSMVSHLESMPSRTHVLPNLDAPEEAAAGTASEHRAALAELRQVMWRHVGLERSADGLQTALDTLDQLAARVAGPSAVSDAIMLASLITLAALRRCESRGAHFRSDHSRLSPGWRRRLVFGPDGIQAEPIGAQRCFSESAPRARRLPW